MAHIAWQPALLLLCLSSIAVAGLKPCFSLFRRAISSRSPSSVSHVTEANCRCPTVASDALICDVATACACGWRHINIWDISCVQAGGMLASIPSSNFSAAYSDRRGITPSILTSSGGTPFLVTPTAQLQPNATNDGHTTGMPQTHYCRSAFLCSNLDETAVMRPIRRHT